MIGLIIMLTKPNHANLNFRMLSPFTIDKSQNFPKSSCYIFLRKWFGSVTIDKSQNFSKKVGVTKLKPLLTFSFRKERTKEKKRK